MKKWGEGDTSPLITSRMTITDVVREKSWRNVLPGSCGVIMYEVEALTSQRDGMGKTSTGVSPGENPESIFRVNGTL